MICLHSLLIKSYMGIVWMYYGVKICTNTLIQDSRQNNILKVRREGKNHIEDENNRQLKA